jgi:hypothetical protein
VGTALSMSTPINQGKTLIDPGQYGAPLGMTRNQFAYIQSGQYSTGMLNTGRLNTNKSQAPDRPKPFVSREI